MTTMVRHLPVLSLVAFLAAGCGTAAREAAWGYSDERPKPTWEDFEVWQRKFWKDLQGAKDACIRETGDSGKVNFWTGYSEVFMACMKVRGFARSRHSDPL
jgi:hypothetical protein